MKWRSASEKPKISGKYQILVDGLYLPSPFSGDVDFATFECWYSTNQVCWDYPANIISWLDPEVPEEFLREGKADKHAKLGGFYGSR